MKLKITLEQVELYLEVEQDKQKALAYLSELRDKRVALCGMIYEGSIRTSDHFTWQQLDAGRNPFFRQSWYTTAVEDLIDNMNRRFDNTYDEINILTAGIETLQEEIRRLAPRS
jgi:hypothetical protein